MVTSYVPGLALDPLALPVTNPPFGKRSLRRGYLLHLVQDLTAICHFFLRLRVNVKRYVCPRKLFARDDVSFGWDVAFREMRHIRDTPLTRRSSRRIIARASRRIMIYANSIERSSARYPAELLSTASEICGGVTRALAEGRLGIPNYFQQPALKYRPSRRLINVN